MIRVVLICLLLSNFLIAGELANKEEFLKMCNNPTPSQKITLEAISKYRLIKIDEQMCAYLYSRTGTSSFSTGSKIKNITDLSPLKFFLNLESLRLYDNKVKDISILKYLTKLEELNLSGNPVSDITPLKDLKYLENLNLHNTNIKNLSPINNIKTLKSLSYGYMESIDSVDISQIQDLINLEFLGLGNIKVKNFCMINKFTKLKRFFAPNTTTNEDLNCFTNLKKLYRLNLKDTKITHIDFVDNFPSLRDLYISNTKVDNIDILKNISTLKLLVMSNTKIIDVSVLSGRQDLILTAHNTELKNCSPKNSKDLRDGKSCLNEDGTLKPWWKRIIGL